MLRVKLLEAGARAPEVAHPGEDLGYDLFALEATALDPRATKRVRTGVAVEARHPGTGAPLGFWCATGRPWQRAALPQPEA